MTLEELTAAILKFRDAREWKQFHTPKNLSAAIAIEAAELQEHFLWQEGSTAPLDPVARQKLAEEVADVLIYALMFAHECGIDPAEAILSKLKKNAERYPVELAKGNSKKYTELIGIMKNKEDK